MIQFEKWHSRRSEYASVINDLISVCQMRLLTSWQYAEEELLEAGEIDWVA